MSKLCELNKRTGHVHKHRQIGPEEELHGSTLANYSISKRISAKGIRLCDRNPELFQSSHLFDFKRLRISLENAKRVRLQNC